MTNTTRDPRRIAVWVAMADHFLDTETRQDIPRTALRCDEAGLSRTEAREVWCLEVSPAVEFNLWHIAGEWVGWDRDWLLKRINRAQPRWLDALNRLNLYSWLDRMRPNGGTLEAITRCIGLLAAQPSAAARAQMTADLCLLSSHYFDFCPSPLAACEALDLKRLRGRYDASFRILMATALVAVEATRAHARVEAAFERVSR